jgi:AcrR family transcriptional regulator
MPPFRTSMTNAPGTEEHADMEAGVRPRRGAPPKRRVERPRAHPRDGKRRDDVRAIGVDTVVERSGVSNTTLYRLFESKDALIAAVAAEQDRLHRAWWDRIEDQHANDPRFVGCAAVWVAKRVGRPAFRGCPFLNLTTVVAPSECPSGAARPGSRHAPARPRRPGSGWWFGA